MMNEKGNKMGFEKRVLEVVEDVVGDSVAGFYNGCLFVECSIPEAVKLETALLKTVNAGIIMTRIGNETAYDFV